GKQNIIEGSKVSGTSKETEIKLMGFARASLDKLLNDFRDILRVRNFVTWDKESREARFVRRIGSNPDPTYDAYREFRETVQLNSSPTSLSASFTRQTIYWINRSGVWSVTSSKKADFANA
ncbi:MAG TPA: hypothetical protein VFO40_09110, partial [Chthoniobacterales bacterium]|nr:hypothetical protein [Chthoniobacterales bacterium]